MMEKLLTVRDMMNRYQCSRQTASRYMRKLEHMEKPLTVRASVVEQWERERTVRPPEVVRREMMLEKLRRANEKGGQNRGKRQLHAG